MNDKGIYIGIDIGGLSSAYRLKNNCRTIVPSFSIPPSRNAALAALRLLSLWRGGGEV